MSTYFADVFGVTPKSLDRYGAFNISLVTDLPLFIDPFLLFNSRKQRYQTLHNDIITYLAFLRDRSEAGHIDPGLLEAWFMFPEVRQNWFGFTKWGNRGSGLGSEFAEALHTNLHRLFSGFGKEKITRGSHLEKLCLIRERVGRDNISDFATNLIKGFLCEYTEEFAKKHIDEKQRRPVSVPKVRFNYKTETWENGTYTLPWSNNDYVLLTPKNILTKDDTWINKTDLVNQFEDLPDAIENKTLRSQVDNYFKKVLGKRRREPTEKEKRTAAIETIRHYPELIDVFIRFKEDRGDQAESVSSERVKYSAQLYVEQGKELQLALAQRTDFYRLKGDTLEEARKRVGYLKDVIENKGGHRIFYVGGEPIEREEDIQIMYRLVWFGTPSDVSREVNDGRGPADFKVSRGSRDKTIVEFKLASNSQLRRNLDRQVEVYKVASDAKKAIKVILYFSKGELRRVERILRDLKLEKDEDVVLIDARRDNKPSGSKA